MIIFLSVGTAGDFDVFTLIRLSLVKFVTTKCIVTTVVSSLATGYGRMYKAPSPPVYSNILVSLSDFEMYDRLYMIKSKYLN